ncbi:MAG: hypothetical protein R2706_19735 [Acidimicrobiales bacterium]
METKRDRFVRLAENRTNKVLETVRVLGNLSNKSQYQYTDDDIHAIFATIRKNLRETEQRFRTTAGREFKLAGGMSNSNHAQPDSSTTLGRTEEDDDA